MAIALMTWDFDIDLRKSPSPELSLAFPYTRPNDIIIVTANFFARTLESGEEQGFLYYIDAEEQALDILTENSGVFANSPTWRSVSHTAIFRLPASLKWQNMLKVFFAYEANGQVNGEGVINRFSMYARVTKFFDY